MSVKPRGSCSSLHHFDGAHPVIPAPPPVEAELCEAVVVGLHGPGEGHLLPTEVGRRVHLHFVPGWDVDGGHVASAEPARLHHAEVLVVGAPVPAACVGVGALVQRRLPPPVVGA
eukprot:CAMPEP_0196741254 /NCGR_PEP_ID=MMETSP1091-20130531/38606_1 /TAXON_ID=302021 /ORGANISM="Rhodomonas sp., Strain CCMP768" /LENGTH=114 /DNA_ID=CAMNT_0042086847 /DNA_START=35 /DNA_END=375 /DNA_ORIENTATION=+